MTEIKKFIFLILLISASIMSCDKADPIENRNDPTEQFIEIETKDFAAMITDSIGFYGSQIQSHQHNDSIYKQQDFYFELHFEEINPLKEGTYKITDLEMSRSVNGERVEYDLVSGELTVKEVFTVAESDKLWAEADINMRILDTSTNEELDLVGELVFCD